MTGIRAKRNEDKRRIEISWEPSPGARGYVLRWGVDQDDTLLSCQTLENKVELGLFSTDQKYYFRVDAFGDGGTAPGRTVVECDL